MKLVLQQQIPDDEILRLKWNALVQQMDRPEVFYTYEWALAVARSYPARAPLLCMAYQGESLVGVAALAHDPDCDEICFLAGTTADYCDFVCHSQHRMDFVKAVFDELSRMKIPALRLANLPADSPTSQAIRRGGRDYGYSMFSRPAYFCAQVEFGSNEARQTLKQSVEHKQMLRRYLKGMNKLGPVSLNHLRSADDIAKALPEFSRTHVARFLSTGRTSNLARPERRAFLAELGRLLSRSGWVTLTGLMVGERAAAWNYGFQFAGGWFWYQPTFDSELHRYSPGFCLLARIVEEACDTPTTNFVDFGLGEEGYKDRMATGGRHTLHVLITRSNFRYAKEAVRYRAAAAVKSMPGLEEPVRRALALGTSVGHRFQHSGVRGLLSWVKTRLSERVGKREVFFFSWNKGISDDAYHRAGLSFQAVDLNLLAVAAMQYVDEPETASYLLRAAKRLRAEESSGFALVARDGIPVHLCWARDFDGFHMAELDHKLSAPSPEAVLIFDCWTPVAMRGSGYYGLAIEALAARIFKSGRRPWIFSAATNGSSVRGVEKAGFTRRFSLVREASWFGAKVIQSEPYTETAPLSHVSAAD